MPAVLQSVCSRLVGVSPSRRLGGIGQAWRGRSLSRGGIAKALNVDGMPPAVNGYVTKKWSSSGQAETVMNVCVQVYEQGR